MKTLTLILALLFVTGCNTTDHKVYQTALTNFVYESDVEDERRIYNTVDREFYGDCEDFAFTLQKQIGGEVWYVKLDDESGYRYHAVLVKDGITYDYLYKSSWVDNYPAWFMFVMVK